MSLITTSGKRLRRLPFDTFVVPALRQQGNRQFERYMFFYYRHINANYCGEEAVGITVLSGIRFDEITDIEITDIDLPQMTGRENNQ